MEMEREREREREKEVKTDLGILEILGERDAKWDVSATTAPKTASSGTRM